ncbi:MAG: cob(I)yrinic acid a,c-diamide adenosyltransferase [Gallionella sp.]|jgi:cob(I)alamin adenosyltransferase|nr:cob(I)yrinic acid a,c-diamide adenosyltransferase [Gallionella sp.]NNM78949.1 cob(I)yrinic acid a,c-diamide adenosyltransferase [Gallionella sp.]
MTEDDARHRQRMARKKAVVDAAIAQAQHDKGLLLILTGNGKGKSSSAFGMVARTLGYGHKVGVAQFLKSRRDTGEEKFLGNQPTVQWHVLGDGFTWDTQNREADIASARRGWQVAQGLLADASLHLVILDELTYLLNYGYLDAQQVCTDLAARPATQHVVVTGRAAPACLLEMADTVSEIQDVKHAFRAGIRAQPGIDL